ncbi:MAG TPA: transposase [Acidobacteriaceae bacterium]
MLAPQEIRTYFITSTTASRRRIFQVDRNAELFLQVLRENRAKSRIQLHAFVVMPDHFHLLLTPAPEISLEKATQYIKGGFSFKLKSAADVWEKGYTNHRVLDAEDYHRHVSYIEQNPIRSQLCKEPRTFPFSSARFALDPIPHHLLQ